MLVIVQSLIVFFIFRLYPLFSMLFFGEGANSFLYTNSNAALWVITPIMSPSLLNLFRITESTANKNKQKTTAYIIIELILLVLYTAFVVWWALNKRFHI